MAKNIKNVRTGLPDEQLSYCHYDIVVKGPSSDATGSKAAPQSQSKNRTIVDKKLDARQLGLLEQTGFKWNGLRTTSLDEKWDAMFQLLLQFKTKNGNCDAPRTHVEEGKNLGNWVHDQRCRKTLDQRQLDLLKQAGFKWNNESIRRGTVVSDEKWDAMFQLLLQFKTKSGNCDVPYAHVEQGKNLGHWVSNQRKKKGNETLDQRRMDLLEQAGFEWNGGRIRRNTIISDKKWDAMFQLLLHFKTENGHCDVPFRHVQQGKYLGRWVSSQRQKKSYNTLDQRRLDLFEQAGGQWMH